MWLRRPSIIAVIVVALISTAAQPVSAASTNRHLLVDSFAEMGTGYSEVFAMPESDVENIVNNIPGENIKNRLPCESLDAAPCTGDTGIGMRIYLPVCSATINTLCIEGLAIAPDSNTALVKANLLGGTDGKTFPANPARGFPEASTPTSWQVPGVTNMGGTDTYDVKVLMDAYLPSNTKKLFIFDLNSVVEGYVGKDLASSTKVDLSEKQRVALTLHLPNTVTGWLNGRLTDPNISIEKIDSTQNRIRVEANPVLVPEISVNLTDEQEASLPTPYYFRSSDQVSWWVSNNAGNFGAIEWIKQLSGVMKNTASGEHRAWFFSTVANNVANASNSCLQDKNQMIGLVTTNSAAYSPGAPDFVNGFLNYQVAGMHYRVDGTSLAIGTYDLVMRSDVARCLYNFTTAPISATVSITNENGTQQVGTTVVSEKNGWLHLGAYGFTYSSPIVKIKLTGTLNDSKVKNTTATSNNSPGNKNQPQKIQGYPITCVKGKTVQKIIASKPMCPYGWKKK